MNTVESEASNFIKTTAMNKNTDKYINDSDMYKS
jgi:hypothetical protein